MRKPKYSVRIGNVYFLARIGLSLRWAAASAAPDQLAPEIRHLLARLDQVEAQEAAAEHAAAAKSDSDAAV
jgi:outer membrane murein-binding lipoprotein Lpp